MWTFFLSRQGRRERKKHQVEDRALRGARECKRPSVQEGGSAHTADGERIGEWHHGEWEVGGGPWALARAAERATTDGPAVSPPAHSCWSVAEVLLLAWGRSDSLSLLLGGGFVPPREEPAIVVVMPILRHEYARSGRV